MAKKIYISPSDQGKNQYGAGNTVEEVQCERIATALVNALQRCKFEAKTDLTANMKERVSQSNNWKADLHVCIHTNAYDRKVAGTRIFCYKLDKSTISYGVSDAIMKTLAPITPGTSDGIQARPELYEINSTVAPCTYIEVDFHDVPEIALWIISHTTEIAEAIAEGICNHYGVAYVASTPATTPAETDNDTNELIKRYIDQLIAKQKDNDCGAWSKEAREWAIANGIIQGIGNGPDGAPNYAWEASVTREQFVTMLHRFAKLIGNA